MPKCEGVPDDIKALALRIRDAFDAISPDIEHYTSHVCPSCERVCCIDRHGTHELEDLAFIEVIGESPSPLPPLDDDTQPCRHLSQMGCSIERWRRPYRCTWYFCSALLHAMPAMDKRKYREFMHKLRELTDARTEFVNALRDIEAEAED